MTTTRLPPVELENYLTWASAEIFTSGNTTLEKNASRIGLVVGATSLVSAYLLAADFGGFVATSSGIRGSANYFMRVLFGLCAYMPTSALYILPTQAEFIRIAKSIAKKPALERRIEQIYWRNKSKLVAGFLAAFAGLPFFNILKEYLDDIPFLRMYLPTQVYLLLSLICYRSEMNLVDKIFMKYHREEVSLVASRIRLLDIITARRSTILQASDDTIQQLYQLVNASPANSPTERLEKIKYLLYSYPCLLINETASTIVIENIFATWRKRIFDIGCYIIGITACLIFIRLSENTVHLSLDRAELDPNVESIIATLCAWIALLPNMVFSALTTQLKSERIHAALVAKNYCPSAKSVIAQVLATFSAVANTYIAIEAVQEATTPQIGPTLLIIPTALGPMLARSVSFEILLDMMLMAYQEKYHAQENKQLRLKLLSMLKQLHYSIECLPGDQLVILEQQLITPSIPSMTTSDVVVDVLADAADEQKESPATPQGYSPALFACSKKSPPIETIELKNGLTLKR